MYALKAEINTAIDSIIIVGIETPLNTVFITLRNKKKVFIAN